MDTIAELGKLKSLGELIDYLKYFDPSTSRASIARGVIDVTAANKHTVSKSLVIKWDQGQRAIYPQQVRMIETIATQTMQTDERIRKDFFVHITIGARRWHIAAYAPCAKCKREFRLSRETSRRCNKCIVKSRAAKR